MARRYLTENREVFPALSAQTLRNSLAPSGTLVRSCGMQAVIANALVRLLDGYDDSRLGWRAARSQRNRKMLPGFQIRRDANLHRDPPGRIWLGSHEKDLRSESANPNRYLRPAAQPGCI